MSSLLLVIADPAAPFLTALSRLPDDLNVFISQDRQELKAKAGEAEAILFAHVDGSLLSETLPLADRTAIATYILALPARHSPDEVKER